MCEFLPSSAIYACYEVFHLPGISVDNAISFARFLSHNTMECDIWWPYTEALLGFYAWIMKQRVCSPGGLRDRGMKSVHIRRHVHTHLCIV